MDEQNWVTGKVTLAIRGIPVEMELTVPATPVKPHRMLPVFQKMTNSIVGLSVEEAEAQGKSISCKAGCGACCRQPVPITEVEVYHIAELVEAMPDQRRKEIIKRFTEAVEHFSKLNWFKRIHDVTESAQNESPKAAAEMVNNVTMDYFREGIPCPFLENESCSIHEARPLSCREYLVTSPAENCQSPNAKNISRIDLMLKPSRSLRALGDERFSASGFLGYVPLIRALELAREFPENYREETGQHWAAAFFDRLVKIGSANPFSDTRNVRKQKKKSKRQKR
ncbi:MAG: YkgJ family cysteine cluster protein [Pyrinomonadaceae bacterium]